MSTFGIVSGLKVEGGTRGIISGDFNGDGITDLAVYGNQQIRVMFQRVDTASFQPSTLLVHRPIRAIAVGRLNRDRFDDIAVVIEKPLSLRIYVGSRQGKFSIASERRIDQSIEQIVLADINNDKRLDVLLFGRKELGVAVYLGNGNGKFRDGQILFPEYSFSHLLVTGFQEDGGIKDVVGVNWISNQVLVFSGFGRMKFSEPSLIQCTTEPTMIQAAYLNPDVNMDLIVGLKDTSIVQTYSGNGLGGFGLAHEFSVMSVPSQVEVADVNGDKSSDVVVLTPTDNTLTVFLNNWQSSFEDRIPFSAGRMPADFVLFRHGRTQSIDGAVLDTLTSQVRVFYNSRIDSTIHGRYAVGVHPAGVMSLDVNHDGWYDLIVANTLSSNVTFLMNRGNGTFRSQIPCEINASPQNLYEGSTSDSSATFLATHPDSAKITVLEVDTKTFGHTTYNIPTTGEPNIISTSLDPLTQFMHVLVLEHEQNRRASDIVSFDQITLGRFIEQTVTVNPATLMLAAAVGDFNGDGTSDLAYAVFDSTARKEEIYQANGFTVDSVNQAKLIWSMPASQPITVLLWASDINVDSCSDLIVNLHAPVNSLSIFAGHRDTLLLPVRQAWKEDLSILSEDRLRVVDLNGDGLPDIACDNSLKKRLRMYINQGGSAFSPAVRLLSTDGMGGFDVADIDNDGVPELIITNTVRGTVRIIRQSQ